MPFKDPDYNREYQRIHATRRREEKRLLLADNPTINPLLVIGERWIEKSPSQAQQLWENHTPEAVAARRERGRARVRRHKAKYPDRVLASAKKTYAKHGEKIRAHARDRYQTIREAENERNRVYYAENAPKILAQKKIYNAEHVEERYQQHVKWAATNPEKIVGYSAARRALKANAPVNDLTAAQWKEIKAAYDYRCVYCPPDCKACKKKTHKLTQDHVTPYIKQGSNTVWNVVPACKSCNSKKHDGPVPSPVQMLLLTIAPAKPLKKKGA